MGFRKNVGGRGGGRIVAKWYPYGGCGIPYGTFILTAPVTSCLTGRPLSGSQENWWCIRSFLLLDRVIHGVVLMHNSRGNHDHAKVSKWRNGDG